MTQVGPGAASDPRSETSYRAVLDALLAQHDQFRAVLAACEGDAWLRPTRCAGWDVGDVVVHMAQTDELAVASVRGELPESERGLMARAGDGITVDDSAAIAAARDREAPGDAIRDRWDTAARALVDILRDADPHRRVVWITNMLSVHTLTATRLSECWIHTGDVAEALGIEQPVTDRLRHIARLAWRTIPYAFAQAGRALAGPVALQLTGPGGEQWEFDPEGQRVTTITGPAADFCNVAARRVSPADTALAGTGPDVAAVLELVRTYAL